MGYPSTCTLGESRYFVGYKYLKHPRMVFSTFSIQDSGLLIGSRFQALNCYFLILRKLTHTLLLPRYLWGLEAKPLAGTEDHSAGERMPLVNRWCFAVVFADVTCMSD